MTRRAPKLDPLEETMENPDLPPIVAQTHPGYARATGRRGPRIAMLLGAGMLVVALVGLKLAA